VPDSAELARFYDDTYTRPPDEAERYARWRALSAVGKADHVLALAQRARLSPHTIIDVGCGDGALLSELHRRGFGTELIGAEISAAAAALARGRDGVAMVEAFDGNRLPAPDRAYDLAVLSHVLEHVPDPAALLREVARVCAAVVVEVPLEANVSARRASKRAGYDDVGHLQRFDRDAMRGVVTAAGLRVDGEILDPLPLAVHRFFARTPRDRAASTTKWAVRLSLARAAPALARRLFTFHYACLCVPAASRR